MNSIYEILIPIQGSKSTSIWTEVSLEDYSHEERAFLVKFLHNQKYDISFNYFDKNT